MGFYSAIKYDIFYKANSRTKKKKNEQTNKNPTEPKKRKRKGILSFAVEWMGVEVPC